MTLDEMVHSTTHLSTAATSPNNLLAYFIIYSLVDCYVHPFATCFLWAARRAIFLVVSTFHVAH